MERRAFSIYGVVQGVGFRPFVWKLARQLDLHGFVRNTPGEVQIEIEGASSAVDQFCQALLTEAPSLARIDRWHCHAISCRGDQEFHIAESECRHTSETVITPDAALCDDCRAELFDAGDRRYRYPFLNCTNCGPRLTIIRSAPYDRARTTMSAFPLCPACQQEYDNPGNRRFHAQPIACPDCGPQLQLRDAHGARLAASDAIVDLVAAIRKGEIAAIKGLGGYHLACDATSETAVAMLRARKHRDNKPLAVMVGSAEHAQRYCHISAEELRLLLSPRAPIVLLRRRKDIASTDQLASSLAPGNPYLGVMLPYTPLHHLLLRAAGHLPLVMTSGNRSDEPIAYQEPEVFEQLGKIADLYLTHNREIHIRCDDSVTRVIGRRELIIRRSRGYAPEPIRLPMPVPQPMLAVGGQLKGTFALAQRSQAIVSHHLGDLDHFEAYRAFVRDVGLYQQMFDVCPQTLVHDRHPDYLTTRYAHDRGARDGLRCIGVQHHHAHVASCMAENDVREPVIGVAFDGTGWGSDGAIWGGEFLLTDYADYKRVAHLRYVPLAGGESATRENWRMAAAYLLDADCDLAPLACWSSGDAVRTLRQMIDRRVNCPLTSSAGRLFDAIAALLGVRGKTTFEAQAAMELEWLATDVPIDGSYPFEIAPPADGAGWPMELDLRPTIRAITREVARGIATAQIARRFHSTMVEMIATMCGRLRDASGLRTVALSGGAFANALLAAESEARLTADGFRVLRHSQVPTNDAGLSLGQLAVAAAVLQQKSSPAESAVGSLAPGRMAGTTRLSTFEMVNTP